MLSNKFYRRYQLCGLKAADCSELMYGRIWLTGISLKEKAGANESGVHVDTQLPLLIMTRGNVPAAT